MIENIINHPESPKKNEDPAGIYVDSTSAITVNVLSESSSSPLTRSSLDVVVQLAAAGESFELFEVTEEIESTLLS